MSFLNDQPAREVARAASGSGPVTTLLMIGAAILALPLVGVVMEYASHVIH